MSIAPFVQSPADVVDRMLIASTQRYAIRAVGLEIDPNLIRESRARIRQAGLRPGRDDLHRGMREGFDALRAH